MPHRVRTLTPTAITVVFTLALGAVWAAPATAQPDDLEPPRLADGTPDFNGIWQALGSAHYDIEPHMARSAMQLREGPHGMLPDAPMLRLGAVGAVPGSVGIIDGGRRIPYTAEARALKEVWMVEGGTPNTLLRRGLRRDYVQPGTVIIVDGYQSKDRTARARGGAAS